MTEDIIDRLEEDAFHFDGWDGDPSRASLMREAVEEIRSLRNHLRVHRERLPAPYIYPASRTCGQATRARGEPSADWG